MDKQNQKNKKEKMGVYKFFRSFLGFIYKLYYNPKVIGAENIPKDGSFLMVGNHVHIMDQCNIIVVTKRCLHYMAKKEYFDSKKTRWFFNLVGCIPVDRSKKDTHATDAALDVLNNGWALGLFPEGTRNGLKEDRAKEIYDKYIDKRIPFEEFYKSVKNNKTSFINYVEELYKSKTITTKEFLNSLDDTDKFLKKLIDRKIITEKDYFDHYLLDFKFGAVSMANKTNSVLVPYAITGEYKFRSKDLVIRIGKPIKPSDNLEKKNKQLRKVILELIQENLKK